MRYKRPAGYRTPHEIIESVKDISKREISFGKNKGPLNEISENSKKREGHRVFKNKQDYDYNLHNHIIKRYLFSKKAKLSASYSVFPSTQDLVSVYSSYLKTGKISSDIISIIKNKKEIGRVHFHIDKFLLNFEKSLLEIKRYLAEKNTSLKDKGSQDMLKIIYLNSFLSSKFYVKATKKRSILNIFSSRGSLTYYQLLEPKQYFSELIKIGLVIKHVPMPGYVL